MGCVDGTQKAGGMKVEWVCWLVLALYCTWAWFVEAVPPGCGWFLGGRGAYVGRGEEGPSFVGESRVSLRLRRIAATAVAFTSVPAG